MLCLYKYGIMSRFYRYDMARLYRYSTAMSGTDMIMRMMTP